MLFRLALLLAGSAVLLSAQDWARWGGPTGDFRIPSPYFSNWPSGGPRVLWSRPLGPGYSAIAVESGRLYTMTRRSNQELVLSLDASSGKTLWEYAETTEFRPQNLEAGHGPQAMPQVFGDLVVACGVRGKIYALAKASGRLVWKRELPGTEMGYGYSSHPVAWRDSLLVQMGGKGHAIVRLRLSDGAVIWSRHSFKNSHASPVLVSRNGRTEAVFWMSDALVGLDPDTGDLLWTEPASQALDLPIETPLLLPNHRMLLTSAYDGALMYEFSNPGPPRLLWSTDRLRAYFSVLAELNGKLYGSLGSASTTFLSEIDLNRGTVVWRSREFGRAHVLAAATSLIVLAEDGTLAMLRPPQTLGRISLLASPARTPPSFSRGMLYARDQEKIVAVSFSGKE